MSTHRLFAASALHRIIPCPGSMSFPENRVDGGSSTYADDGSASHELGAMTLNYGGDCSAYLGHVITINGTEYIFDEERCDRIQGYVDDVRRRAVGGYLFVERSSDVAEDVGGTADAAIVLPGKRLGIIEDLKDGSGEKVYASYVVKAATDTTPELREPNPQLATYALGLLPDFEIFGPIDSVLLVIYQPKLNHIDEFLISVAHLRAFGEKLKLAVVKGRRVLVEGVQASDFNPGRKQCRWCRAPAAGCTARLKFVEDAMRCNFDTIAAADPTGLVPKDTTKLASAYAAIPFIAQWCAAVVAEVNKLVQDGQQVIGPDGKPYKFVEGKEGARAWSDVVAAEAALVGQLGPKAYSEPKLLTAPAAGKLLDRKATKAIWTDLFVPLMTRPRGQPILVMGSDDRPPFSGAASVDDFEDEVAQ
jgi:hypothetical protein